ncbi:hypothetical protein BKM31_14830 [[Actinomadura] parvosata subsp. kistnae]|uniref:Chaplin domain-containing protein n=1 Tax=[Actinomadura] parvosata subsp. kistnae TaxID=1909395 RepID=A0A1U9ZX93_9ACTN|nr:hypothetical protein BKM31_14830 [Nonomuraea sp. ATCC 55076]
MPALLAIGLATVPAHALTAVPSQAQDGDPGDDDGEGDVADEFGLINFGNDSDLLSNLNVCEVEVNIIAIPILDHDDESQCVTVDNDDDN